MSDYQVIARKFRPQSFKDVVGQEAIVTTLKNAIKSKRLAHAYLFCGSRGTGKTTLARLLAKAINCLEPTSDYEPCNHCSSCRDILSGMSLDVLEIDGASHRGIEDIRQINDTVGYASSGHYKIYIIDEVHMLTKEAFNALLKTLEEPPPKVKFFFATTEPHKVPPTILSRCQRFNLNRISPPLIITKLRHIAQQLEVDIEEDALRLLAQRAEGGLRDAESLFDQILAFEEGCITVASITAILGLMPREVYFEIDEAGKAGQFVKAFEIAHRVFSEGKDLSFFIEGLIEHLRQILLVKISGVNSPFMTLADSDKEKYAYASSLYSREQCLDLIEYLIEAQTQLRITAFGKFSLETILLHVMRSHFRLSIEQLVRHLSELEQQVNDRIERATPLDESEIGKEIDPTPSVTPQLTSVTPQAIPVSLQTQPAKPSAPNPPLSSPPPPQTKEPLAEIAIPLPNAPTLFKSFTTEDPTPSSADINKIQKAPKTAAIPAKKEEPTDASQPTDSPFSTGIVTQTAVVNAPPLPVVKTPSKPNPQKEDERPMHIYDTLMHFAAVELEGKLQKN